MILHKSEKTHEERGKNTLSTTRYSSSHDVKSTIITAERVRNQLPLYCPNAICIDEGMIVGNKGFFERTVNKIDVQPFFTEENGEIEWDFPYLGGTPYAEASLPITSRHSNSHLLKDAGISTFPRCGVVAFALEATQRLLSQTLPKDLTVFLQSVKEPIVLTESVVPGDVLFSQLYMDEGKDSMQAYAHIFAGETQITDIELMNFRVSKIIEPSFSPSRFIAMAEQVGTLIYLMQTNGIIGIPLLQAIRGKMQFFAPIFEGTKLTVEAHIVMIEEGFSCEMSVYADTIHVAQVNGVECKVTSDVNHLKSLLTSY